LGGQFLFSRKLEALPQAQHRLVAMQTLIRYPRHVEHTLRTPLHALLSCTKFSSRQFRDSLVVSLETIQSSLWRIGVGPRPFVGVRCSRFAPGWLGASSSSLVPSRSGVPGAPWMTRWRIQAEIWSTTTVTTTMTTSVMPI